MRLVRVLMCVAAVAACCEVQAGVRNVARSSSRTQSQSGSYGHFVSIPNGTYEGVAVASTRRDAIRNACYANDSSKQAISKSVSRGANGMFYSSVIYKNR